MELKHGFVSARRAAMCNRQALFTPWEVLTKAFSRIVAIDSKRWIEFLLDVQCAAEAHGC